VVLPVGVATSVLSKGLAVSAHFISPDVPKLRRANSPGLLHRRYDDDVGGSFFVDGRGGVELDPLDAAKDAAARRTAEQLFKELVQAG